MASSYVGGLSGAFIPVSEDRNMIEAATNGSLCIEKLEAQNARFIELTTDEWRRAAVRSYLRAGFLPVDSDSDMVERWTTLLREIGISNVPMLNRECQTVRML